MLFSRGLRGLGANIQPSSLPGGTVQAVQTAFGLTRADVDLAKRKAQLSAGERWNHEYHAFGQMLQPCPTSWPACDGAPNILPPGTFEVFGFPFHVAELKDGRFDRYFTPDQDQRVLIEVAVIERSIDAIARQVVRLSPEMQARVVGGSVSDFMAAIPDAKLAIPGMQFKPIPPMSSEMNDSDGLRTWSDRGGFFISQRIATGQDQFYDSLSLSTCVSTFCSTCNGSIPACIRGWIGKHGLITSDNRDDITENGTWSPYIAFEPSAMHMVLVFDDPAWYARMANAVAETFTDIANALCALAPIAQSQLSTLTQDKCLDTAGKPCTKGQPNCKCVSPSTSTQASIGITNFVMNKWCSSWGEEQQGPLPLPPPMTNPPIVPYHPPWGWIIGIGLVAGAVLYARK